MFRGRWRVEMPRKWGGFFRNDAEHRDFTAIGTAAGVQLLADLHGHSAPSAVRHICVMSRCQCCIKSSTSEIGAGMTQFNGMYLPFLADGYSFSVYSLILSRVGISATGCHLLQ